MAEEGSGGTGGGGVMRGLRGIVLGVANNRSIAWGIAKAARAAGADIALTYQGEALEKRVRPLAVIDVSDAVGAGAFVVLGFAGLIAGASYLQNVLPLGTFT